MKKVVGIGSPIIDEIAFVDDSFIKRIGSKGGMKLISESELNSIKKDLDYGLTRLPGGSSGNTIFALSKLGTPTSFIGKVGSCDSGSFYRKSLLDSGGDSKSLKVGLNKNGSCISLVTPDGERTMRTYLGASTELSENELRDSDFNHCDHLHIEGFMIQNRSVLDRSIQLAKKHNCTISFDLASFEIVFQSKDQLHSILNDSVDIVLANEHEASAFTGYSLTESEKSVNFLNKLCPIAIVKLGSRGSIISSKQKIYRIDAIPAKHVVDTTGAGDFWAAGFLHGILSGKTIEESAYIASQLGSMVIQNHGGTLTDNQWKEIHLILKTKFVANE